MILIKLFTMRETLHHARPSGGHPAFFWFLWMAGLGRAMESKFKPARQSRRCNVVGRLSEGGMIWLSVSGAMRQDVGLS